MRALHGPKPGGAGQTKGGRMPTMGYFLGQSPFEMEGITLQKSNPPGCIINFSHMVYWAGHKMTASAKVQDGVPEVYVTLKVPRQGPLKGCKLKGAARLGVLEPGRYPVRFYFRKQEKGVLHQYQLVDCQVLVADGVPSLIKPSDSSEWNAWLNLMPPGPPSLHVTGKIKVKDKNTVVNLVRAVPQGFNPMILILEVEAKPSPKPTPATQAVHFSEIVSGMGFSDVDIRFPNGQLLPKPPTIKPVY